MRIVMAILAALALVQTNPTAQTDENLEPLPVWSVDRLPLPIPGTSRLLTITASARYFHSLKKLHLSARETDTCISYTLAVEWPESIGWQHGEAARVSSWLPGIGWRTEFWRARNDREAYVNIYDFEQAEALRDAHAFAVMARPIGREITLGFHLAGEQKEAIQAVLDACKMPEDEQEEP